MTEAFSVHQIQLLKKLLMNSEEWLMHRILEYAKRQDYTRYTSTLVEAWRLSITGLTESLIQGLDVHGAVPEMGPDETFAADPLTRFGIVEAQKHRERGVSLKMFLGLMKYYLQTYEDLIATRAPDDLVIEPARRFIKRSFDRIEIAFCCRWTETNSPIRLQEMESTTRQMTNEKNLYLTILESLHHPTIIVDDQQQILTANTSATALAIEKRHTGYYHRRPADTSEQRKAWGLPDHSLAGFKLTEQFPFLKNEKTDATGYPSMVSENSSGTTRYFECSTNRLRDVSGKFSATILSLTDITQRKRFEDDRRQLERLKRSESLAVLAGGVAHDFNNLMAVVASNARIARKRGGTDETALAKSTTAILNAVERGNSLTRTMRACTGTSLGRVTEEEMGVLIDEWLIPLKKNLSPLIELQIIVNSDLPQVKIDTMQFPIVIGNIVENSIEAIGDAAGHIQIRVEQDIAPHKLEEEWSGGLLQPGMPVLSISIQDDGCGIPEELLASVFDPFFSTKFTGRGLGMAAVKGLVHAHRGRITIDSTPNKGTNVVIQLPISLRTSVIPDS